MSKVIAGLFFLAATWAASATSANIDQTVVSQGGVSVTLGDVDAYMREIPAEKRAGFASKPQRIETMLRAMLVQKQLAEQARAAGLASDPVVQSEIAKQAATQAAKFAVGKPEADPVVRNHQQWLIDRTLAREHSQRFRAGLKVPDFTEQAAEEYIAHKSKYVEKGRFDVKQLLIEYASRGEEEAYKLAEATQARAKADPEQFDALIAEVSEDPNKNENKGLIENVAAVKLPPALVEAATALKNVGDISSISKSTYGYHLLKLVRRDPDRQQSLDEVKAAIVTAFEQEWTTQQLRGLTDELRNKPMDANSDLVESLRTRYQPTAGTSAGGTPSGSSPPVTKTAGVEENTQDAG